MDLGTTTDLTMHKGSLWVTTGTTVSRLDPLTGTIVNDFPAGLSSSTTALCSDGEHLWVGDFVSGTFKQFDTDGSLIDMISLDVPNLFTAGAHCDSERFYVASHATGDVHLFDRSGNSVGLIDISLVADITSIAVSADGQTLWVVTGAGINQLLQYDLAGNLLATFDGPPEAMMGIVALADSLFADGFESGNTSAWSGNKP